MFQNKSIKILIIFLALVTIVYLILGHQLIALIYQDKSISFLNKLLEGRSENSLDYYTKKMDGFLLSFMILFSSLVFAFQSLLRLYQNRSQSLLALNTEFQNLKNKPSSCRNYLKPCWVFLTLFLIFYALYLHLGVQLIPWYRKTEFFGSDYTEAIRGWIDSRGKVIHKGSHPLFLLLVIPLANFSKILLPIPYSAIFLNSLFASIAVLLSSIFFFINSQSYTQTLLLAITFGLSMSQLVFGSLPESYSIACCSIVLTYILFLICIKTRNLYLAYWIVAGLLSFGVTITNFVQTLICFAATVFGLQRPRKIILILEYASCVLSFAFLLSLIQKITFPQSSFFFEPSMFANESQFIKNYILEQPFLVLSQIINNFFMVNFVSPSPFAIPKTPISPMILSFFNRPLDYNLIGWLGIVVWLGLFILGTLKNIQSLKTNFLIIGILLAVIFNIFIHSLFGVNEMFLYTCNFTFPVLLLAINQSLLSKAYFKIGFVLLIILMAINNLIIMNQISSV